MPYTEGDRFHYLDIIYMIIRASEEPSSAIMELACLVQISREASGVTCLENMRPTSFVLSIIIIMIMRSL